MKKLIAVAIMTAMLASLASCGKSSNAAETEYIYGKIDSVSGNDIVLLLADYNENAESCDSDISEKKDKDNSSDETDEKKSRSFKKSEDGEMPEGFDPSKFSGEIPEGFTKPENGEMSEGFDPSKFSGEKPDRSSEAEDGEKTKSFSKSDKVKKSGSKKNSKYTLTGEQEEFRIPVGTNVTTSLGVKTDFDALSAGDIIKCSVEKNSDGKDVITEVWIMEQ